jgi:coenzyme Q-binding protein COQ10
MPAHSETRVMPYSPEKMFDLVADIESYPEFLLWCTGARINSREGDVLLADLDIGFGMFSETFTSQVTLVRPDSIDVEHARGPFRHLVNHWRFKPHGAAACEVAFEIDFEFRSKILERLIGAVFFRAFEKMVGSFEDRAAEIYANSSKSTA